MSRPAEEASPTEATSTVPLSPTPPGEKPDVPEDRLKVWYEHAKLANTHADGQIQAVERKGTFLLTLNAALLLLMASDLAVKLKTLYTTSQGNPLVLWAGGGISLGLAIGFAALLYSFYALYEIFRARIEENEFSMGPWQSNYRPKELIFFGAISNLSKETYFGRYESLTLRECCEDLAFQAYKQARIASIKYGWFSKARRASAWAWATAMAVVVVTRLAV